MPLGSFLPTMPYELPPTPRPVDYLSPHPTQNDFYKRQGFIVEDSIWYIVDYSVEYEWNTPRYRVRLRSDEASSSYDPFTGRSSPREMELKYKTISYAECGECGAYIFFVLADGYPKRLILRDWKCCVGNEIRNERKKVLDDLFKDFKFHELQNLFKPSKKIIS